MRMYPKSNKIELFSRKEIDGWDAFGNQVVSKQDISNQYKEENLLDFLEK